jgi:hypothetical protein
MAELHVQRKETNVWPWVIGIVLVAIVLWFVFLRADTGDRSRMTGADTVNTMRQAPGAPSAPPAPGTP